MKNSVKSFKSLNLQVTIEGDKDRKGYIIVENGHSTYQTIEEYTEVLKRAIQQSYFNKSIVKVKTGNYITIKVFKDGKEVNV